MKKRILALVMCIAMIVPVMTGCFGEAKPVIAQKVDNVFKAQFATLPEGISFNSQFFVIGERVYLMCTEEVSYMVEPGANGPKEGDIAVEYDSRILAPAAVGEPYVDYYSDEPYEMMGYRTVLYSLDFNGENPETEIVAEHDAEMYLQNFTMSEDGRRARIDSMYDQESGETIYTLKSIDADGNEVFAIDVPSLFPPSESEYEYYYFYPQDLEIDADGYVYIASGEGVIAVVTPTGEKAFELKVDTGYINQMENIGGSICVAYYDYQNSKLHVKNINRDTKAFESSVEFADSFNTNAYNLILGDGYDVYFRSSMGLYGYNSGDADSTEIIDWINSDINPNNVNEVEILSADKFIYSGYNPVTYAAEVAFLTRIPDDEVVPKYIITMASTGSSTYDVLDYLIAFNRQNEQYRIVLDDYSRYQTPDDYEMGVKVLNNDIAAGKIPDLLLSSGYDMLPMDSYENKGLFADLYYYFENDPDVSADLLLKCLRTPYEKNGKLFRYINSFLIRSVSAKTSSVGGSKTSWTISEMIELARQADAEGKYLFGLMTKQSMLDNIAYMGINEFIDPVTYQCSFDSETFINLIEYINTLPNEDEVDYDKYYEEMYANDDYYSGYKTGKILLNMEYIYNLHAYMETKYNVFGGDEFTYIGYPGAPDSGSAISPRMTYSISAKSHETIRDGSWQFIKFLLSDEMQGATRYQFPATYTALDKVIENMKTEPWYPQGSLIPRVAPVDENVEEIVDEVTESDDAAAAAAVDEAVPAEESESDETADAKLDITLPEPAPVQDVEPVFFNDDDARFMIDFLDSIVHKGNDDNKILEIINEECGPFFAGSKSAVETARVIQSKVSIYINESK